MTDYSLSLEERRLPAGSIGHRASGWWAMLFLIVSEAAVFAFLLFSYYYIALQQPAGSWPPESAPPMALSLANTVILLASSVAVWWGERSIKHGNSLMLSVGLGIGLLLGIVFVAIQGLEWSHKNFTLSSNAYGSLYFTITGFHIAHVVAGLIAIAATLAWSLLGYFDPIRHTAVSTTGIYWHFVDAVWLTLFFTFYILPHLR